MKNLRIFLISVLISTCTNYCLSQETNEGEINESILKEIKSSFKDNAETEAVINAVSNNNINKLTLNRENIGKVDNYFSNRVKTAGITDQKSTGRCWLFTGLNVLRPKIIEKYNLEDFSFSHNFSFFWDQLEKANLFLEAIITTSNKDMDDETVKWLLKNPINDGGQWTGVVDITLKYGLIPASVMPETYNSENTRIMSRLIRRKLRENALILREKYRQGKELENIRNAKTEMLSEIYRLLAITLGEPTEDFEWRYEDKDGNISELKKYTPKSFYKEFVCIDLNDYIMLMNDPSREYNKLYEIRYDRHMHEGNNWKYINLDIDKIKEFAKLSILDDEAMYFSCDVGKQLEKENGFLDINNYDYSSLFGINFNMDKKQRIQTFESGSSHGMTLVAVDIDENGKPKKWLLENSWGVDSGFNGHLIMTDKWFDEYMFRIVINKKFISNDVLEILKQNPVVLPPWDPMFLPDN